MDHPVEETAAVPAVSVENPTPEVTEVTPTSLDTNVELENLTAELATIKAELTAEEEASLPEPLRGLPENLDEITEERKTEIAATMAEQIAMLGEALATIKDVCPEMDTRQMLREQLVPKVGDDPDGKLSKCADEIVELVEMFHRPSQVSTSTRNESGKRRAMEIIREQNAGLREAGYPEKAIDVLSTWFRRNKGGTQHHWGSYAVTAAVKIGEYLHPKDNGNFDTQAAFETHDMRTTLRFIPGMVSRLAKGGHTQPQIPRTTAQRWAANNPIGNMIWETVLHDKHVYMPKYTYVLKALNILLKATAEEMGYEYGVLQTTPELDATLVKPMGNVYKQVEEAARQLNIQ